MEAPDRSELDPLRLQKLTQAQPSRIAGLCPSQEADRTPSRRLLETALLPAPFWCTKRAESAHFDWRWRERPALALLAWEACSRSTDEATPHSIRVNWNGN
jgi:hypothetical protein